MTCSGDTLTRLIDTWADVAGTFEGQHKPFAVLTTGYALLFAGIVSGLVAWRRKTGNPEPPILKLNGVSWLVDPSSH